MKKTCISCAEYKRCAESSASLIYFIIGMISTIALRVVTLLAHLKEIYGQIAWYIGVAGFFLFFVYKYRVDNARYRLIVKQDLMGKFAAGKELAPEDRQVISTILCALSSNKDRINYFLIFLTSALAILIALYFDFIK